MSSKRAARVLLAHEYGLFLRGARTALVEPEFTVVAETRHGAQLLGLVRRFSPELVLLGARMGNESTVRLVADLTKTCNAAGVVVVDHGRKDENSLFLRAGAQAVLSGLVDPLDLVNVMRAALSGESKVAFSAARPASYADDAGLTAREVEILRCLVRSLRNDEIASELGVTRNTVKHHLDVIYSKLHARNRIGAMRWALKHNV